MVAPCTARPWAASEKQRRGDENEKQRWRSGFAPWSDSAGTRRCRTLLPNSTTKLCYLFYNNNYSTKRLDDSVTLSLFRRGGAPTGCLRPGESGSFPGPGRRRAKAPSLELKPPSRRLGLGPWARETACVGPGRDSPDRRGSRRLSGFPVRVTSSWSELLQVGRLVRVRRRNSEP